MNKNIIIFGVVCFILTLVFAFMVLGEVKPIETIKVKTDTKVIEINNISEKDNKIIIDVVKTNGLSMTDIYYLNEEAKAQLKIKEDKEIVIKQ